MSKPLVLKLLQVLSKNQSHLDCRLQPKPYGGTNPYYYCACCRRSMIEVSYAGHFDNCEYEALEKKIQSIKGQLRTELKRFLENKEFESKSFRHYLWFKQDIGIDQLWILEQYIKDYQKKGIIPTI